MPLPSVAAGSYAAAQRLTDVGAAGSGASSGFADLVKQSVAAFEGQAQASDQQVSQAISGKADYVNVVTSVAESESAIETLVAVRDKVIAAYDEIMRMTV